MRILTGLGGRLSFVAVAMLGAAALAAGCGGPPSPAEQPRAEGAKGGGDIPVAVPAQPGPVTGRPESSDAFMWEVFADLTSPLTPGQPRPVKFETWASDKDTFSTTPHWPDPGKPLALRGSLLAAAKNDGADPARKNVHALAVIDEACKPPPGAAIGNFPVDGNPLSCIAEQVSRNRAQFDYIVGNKLNTQAGLAAAFASGFAVDMPVASVAVKGDWVPTATLPRWIPGLDPSRIHDLYFTATVANVEYALVSMHVASRQNQNWVWATFEHQLNPGRCDYMGCFDSFGAQVPAVAPNRTAMNAGYGACAKTPQVLQVLARFGNAPAWQSYCLKASEVDFVRADGVPYTLGNSVVEGIVGNGTVAASSCITCHAYASFGANGAPTPTATNILPFNPTGKPLPAVLAGSHTFSFMWGVLLAP